MFSIIENHAMENIFVEHIIPLSTHLRGIFGTSWKILKKSLKMPIPLKKSHDSLWSFEFFSFLSSELFKTLLWGTFSWKKLILYLFGKGGIFGASSKILKKSLKYWLPLKKAHISLWSFYFRQCMPPSLLKTILSGIFL